MPSLTEAQQQFFRAIERLEKAGARVQEKQAEHDKLRKAYAQLDAENRSLRALNAKISERLERAIAQLRETLEA